MADGQHSPTTFVILGGTGDLTRRLLFPALHRLMSAGRVPTDLEVVGYAVEDWTTEQFVQHLHDGVEQFTVASMPTCGRTSRRTRATCVGISRPRS